VCLLKQSGLFQLIADELERQIFTAHVIILTLAGRGLFWFSLQSEALRQHRRLLTKKG
jgi:hypothetical protein